MIKTKATNKQIEQKYEKEDRGISLERNDFLLPQILDFVNQKQWMNLQPEYQRRQVWDRKKQSQFIESLLMNLPIPPVFLFEPEYNRYEVMDGQQRLSAIVAFYSNRLKLIGLEQWSELNGKEYSDLPNKVQRGLDRRRLSAVVLQSTPNSRKDDELRRIVFERLNTGGQKLNAQELRNCIFASLFAQLIVELAGDPIFNDLWEIPRYQDHLINDQVSAELAENILFKRMVDCELVLRFFAFRDKKLIKGSVKSILDNCMESHLSTGPDTLVTLANIFKSRIKLAYDLFGLSAFKIKELDGTEKLSQPFYDAVVVACDRQYENRKRLIAKKTTLARKIKAIVANVESYELIVGRANTAETIKKRLNLIENCFVEVL